MDLNKLNDYYLNNLLDKLSKENIEYDFNIDLLKFDEHSPTNDSLESPFFSYAPTSYCKTNKNNK